MVIKLYDILCYKINKVQTFRNIKSTIRSLTDHRLFQYLVAKVPSGNTFV